MAPSDMRGIRSDQELKTSALTRDTRSLGQKIAAGFNKPTVVAVVVSITAAGAVIIPAIADILIMTNIGFIAYAATRKAKLPFRLPQ